MSATTTAAPSEAMRTAAARPIPEPDAVITATFPSNSPKTDLLAPRSGCQAARGEESSVIIPTDRTVCGTVIAALAHQICRATAALSPRD